MMAAGGAVSLMHPLDATTGTRFQSWGFPMTHCRCPHPTANDFDCSDCA
ncbi:hypothetical protein PF002_g31475 [Phytophthora fragariae]|uniref:Uncharacterized protein n=1 Tax=Phytophthora fragariae TaxID=53985 RepID=A0A6A3DG77_9STRA|nr:hypothetical protein PF009_g28930 [Phytophthora fragariae]KAE9164954.1 hypothetical protein PF002_g31475 [Phytophthora fragariae]KAE9263777.1 hypothetical protein PF001_g31550 [Phytophthora fragariae]